MKSAESLTILTAVRIGRFLARIRPLTLQQIADPVNVKMKGPGAPGSSPVLDFSTEDAI